MEAVDRGDGLDVGPVLGAVEERLEQHERLA
jgi:hypothetical protein